MLLKRTSKLFFKNLTKAISFAKSLIVVFTLFSSPSLAAKTSMTGTIQRIQFQLLKHYKQLLILQKILQIKMKSEVKLLHS